MSSRTNTSLPSKSVARPYTYSTVYAIRMNSYHSILSSSFSEPISYTI